MKLLLIIGLSVLALLLLAFGAALAFGGPGQPSTMASIGDPFKTADFSSLPSLERYRARDGAQLGFRHYAPPGVIRGSAILIHGSSASSVSMHPLARGLAAAGFEVFTLDIRGHGDSGPKGQIAYIGQLEDDLEDFAKSRVLAQPSTLVGLSAGGGFALRFAGSARQDLFSSYLLLSPYLRYDAPTFRQGGPEWAQVGIPRFLALRLLDGVGLRIFQGLPVTRFALSPEDQARLTPWYGFRLNRNFQPHDDYQADIRQARRPMALVVGTADELFQADQFENVFRSAGKPIPVRLVPGVGHVTLILAPEAIQATVETLECLQKGS